MFNNLLKSAYEAINLIKDPAAKVEAIAKILPYAGNSVVPADIKASETTAAEKTIENVISEPIDVSKPAVVAMAEEKAEQPAVTKEEAVKAIADEEIVVPEPKADETPAEAERRRVMFTKKHGSVTLAECIANEEYMKLLMPEMTKAAELRQLLHDKLDKYAAEKFVDDLHFNYVKESDEAADSHTEVTMDKFLNVYCKYMEKLLIIYKHDMKVVDEAIGELLDVKPAHAEIPRVGKINISNASALIDVINDIEKAA